MSKNKSIEPLIKLTHGESIETLELKEKINLLTNMLSHPTKSKRDTYVASYLYDKKGNFNTEHWGYQLVGTAALTSVPIVLICGSATAALARGVDFNPTFLLAMTGMVGAEALAICGTGAYMTIKGSKMNEQIKKELIDNLISLGYQVTEPMVKPIQSIDKYKINNERLLNGEVISVKNNKYISLIEEDEFVTKISNLINQILENKYPRYQYDIDELKQVALDWIALNFREYKRTGKKLGIIDAPMHLYEAFESEILAKINKTLKKVSK